MPGLSPARSEQPIQVSNRPVRIGPGATVLGWLLRRSWRLLVLIVSTPPALAALLVLIALMILWRVSPVLVLGLTDLGLGLLVACRIRWPRRWLAWVRLPLRSWRRAGWSTGTAGQPPSTLPA